MNLNKKNITIVEISTENHYSLVENWIFYCKSHGVKVRLFTKKAFLRNIKDEVLEEVEVITCNPLKFLFVELYRRFLFGHDTHYLMTSVQSDFLFFVVFFCVQKNLSLTIHNVNSWFGIGKSNKFKYYLKSKFRSIIFSQSTDLILNSKNMLDYYMKMASDFNIHKVVSVMPFKIYQGAIFSSPKAIKNIVYPGMVCTLRKKYDLFLQLAQSFPDIKFHLLGKLVGGQSNLIVEEVEERKISNVIFYNGFVERECFDNIISNCDLIFGDIKTSFLDMEFFEIYGLTKDSGISYFSIEYAKLLLVNKEFKNFKDLSEMTFYFDDFESAKKIIEYLQDRPKFNVDLIQSSLEKFKITNQVAQN